MNNFIKLIIVFIAVQVQGQTKGNTENQKIAFGPYIQQMSTKDATICWSTLESEPTITDKDGETRFVREYKHHKIYWSQK